MPTDMDGSVLEIVQRRHITEVVHFTSNNGLLHILKRGAVLSRKQLEPQFYAENIMNAQRRWDTAWFDYISLSISWINATFFAICKDKWYANTDRFWVALSFTPDILGHNGVVFATTNNGYEPNVRRGCGVSGLEALFESPIAERQGRSILRTAGLPPKYPTCPQAEALYKRSLPLEYLRCVYVYDWDLLDVVAAQAHTLRVAPPNLVVDASRFQNRPVMG